MKIKTAAFLVLFSITIFSQNVVTTNFQYPTENDSIIIYFDASLGTAGLKNYTGDIYAHTGVITNKSISGSDWKYVMAPWNTNYSDLKLTRVSTNLYSFAIGKPRQFYSGNHQNLGTIPPEEKIEKLAFVFRNVNGTLEGKDVGGTDIFVQLYEPGLTVIVNSPVVNTSFGHPDRSPVFIDENASQLISVTTSELGTQTKNISLYINNILVSVSETSSLEYNFLASNFSARKNEIKVIAEDTSAIKDTAEFSIFKNIAPKQEPLPHGNQIGINYDENGAPSILALFAPYKKNVFLLGDFNDWKVDTSFAMYKHEVRPDSVIWWCMVPYLLVDPHPLEYRYQFLIDGSLRIQDPYSEKILDPYNDNDAELKSAYPDLIGYPAGKTEGIVSVLDLGNDKFNWAIENFERPRKESLVIYELLLRDFLKTHSFKTLKDTLSYFRKLGINAIELMPINEFEGNSSWGYNPMMYFAPDKYYGTKNQLKEFIDACHQNGIAVILDIVLNHSYGQNSMVRMYWNSAENKPAANSPWFNQVSPNTTYSWGYDFNHESSATKYFVDRVTSFWLNEYKVDGFRFDFTKGFTNTPGDGWRYDLPRINILKRIADKIWSESPGAYVILEHLAENSEEIVLSNYGMMLWGNMNYSYNEATMGWLNNSNFSNISYKARGWSKPNLVGYMESHDEERLMYKNITRGNSSGNYNIKNLSTALDRIELAAALFITVPGPKMIWQFGELGYDKSINYPSGTSVDRLTPKPILWEYFSEPDRKDLFNVFAALIRLKKAYPVFSSGNFTLSASGAVKSLSITDSSMNVNIYGNFDLTEKTVNISSAATGYWYEFFTGDSIMVSNVATQITLQPGEYRLFTTQKLPPPEIIVGIAEEEIIPSEFMLAQNYPNPFNPFTTIKFSVPEISKGYSSSAGIITLKIYDMLGRELTTLVNEEKLPGNYEVFFDGSRLASGIYFYKLSAGSFTQTKKMVLVK